MAGLHSQEAAALLQQPRQVVPSLSPATAEDLQAALDLQLHQLESRVEELRGGLRSNRRKSIKDYWRGRVTDLQLRSTVIRGGHQRGEQCPVRLVVNACPGLGEGAHGGFGRHWRGPEVLGGAARQAACEPTSFRTAGQGPDPWKCRRNGGRCKSVPCRASKMP